MRSNTKTYNFTSYSGVYLQGTLSSTTTPALSATRMKHTMNMKAYELSNHLGNVLVTVSDARQISNSGSTVTGFVAIVKSATDYSAFGAPMAGRSYTSSSYRYSFNGKEKEDEMVSGDVDFGARMYDARLGRWLSVDPRSKEIPDVSPMVFVSNCPLASIDPDGEKEKPYDPSKDRPVIQRPNTATPKTAKTTKGVFVTNVYMYNCHSYAWHNRLGDPTDPGNKTMVDQGYTRWDQSPADDIKSSGAQQLSSNEPNKLGDRVVYYVDANSNGIYEEGEQIEHSAVVSKVDADGNTVEVTGKMGESGIADNHPGAPGYYAKLYQLAVCFSPRFWYEVTNDHSEKSSRKIVVN